MAITPHRLPYNYSSTVASDRATVQNALQHTIAAHTDSHNCWLKKTIKLLFGGRGPDEHAFESYRVGFLEKFINWLSWECTTWNYLGYDKTATDVILFVSTECLFA